MADPADADTPSARARVDALVAEKGVVAAGQQLGVAAILYTYQCTIACRHCCFACGAHVPRVHMSTPKAVEHLRALHGLGRVIHIAGGECMMHWNDLQSVLARSQAEGVQPHFIETNCSFATDDAVVAERLAALAAAGVVGILASADPFHQASVPPDRFLRVRRQARDLFGPHNVWCSGATDDEIRALADIAADEARLRDYVRRHPPNMVGTAHRELRPFLDAYPLDQMPLDGGWRSRYQARDCALEFDIDRIWEVHIDPYNNIQTNCGVVLGNTDRIGLRDVMERGPANANLITRLLAEGGPFALADFARDRHGFAIPATAVSKCDLCFTTRRFLRPFYPDILAPDEVYGA